MDPFHPSISSDSSFPTTAPLPNSTETTINEEPEPSMESPWGSLLLATINTIQGNTIAQAVVWAGFRNFYLLLEREFNLEYGRILLALASPAELKAMVDRDWPYLDSYREAVDACLQQGDCGGISNVTQSLGSSQASVLFSPHLIESDDGWVPPFSLIPFCAYQGELSTLGTQVPLFPSLSVCSQSTPTIVDGTLCYIFAPGGPRTKQGEEFGLDIVLDSTPVTPDPNLLEDHVPTGNEENHWKLEELASRNEAEVYIPTLNRFKGSAKGHFSMTGLKIITATKKFLDRRGSSGSCSLKSFDNCHRDAFINRVSNDCGCTPFALSLELPQQVRLFDQLS